MKYRAIIVLLLMGMAMHGMSQQIEVAVQKGHSGDILAIAFNHDGKLLASAASDNLIKLWHVPTGREMASFISATTSKVIALSFRGDNDFLDVEYKDKSKHVWHIATSKLETISHEEGTFNPKRYVSVDQKFDVVLDAYSLKKRALPGESLIFSNVSIDISRNFSSVAVSEKNQLIFAGNEDGKIYVYDLKKGKNVNLFEEHYSTVNAVCLSADESMLASASSDRSIIIWDTRNRIQLKRLFGKSFRFETIAFNHAGTQLVAGDELGRGRIVELQSSRVRVSAHQWHEQKIGKVAFSHDDSAVYSGGFDNRLVTFDVAKEEVRRKDIYKNYVSTGDYFLKIVNAYREPYAWITALDVSPKGNRIAYGGGWRESAVRGQPQVIWLRDLNTGEDYRVKSHAGSVNDICFLDEFSFLSVGAEGLMHWYFDAAANEFYFRKKSTGLNNIAHVSKGSGSTVLLQADHCLMLYDLSKEVMIDSIRTSKEITAVTFSPADGKLVYAHFNQLVFTNIATWHTQRRMVSTAHSDRITDLAFNPVRPMIASSSWDATIKLWNPETAELLATIISIGMEDHLIITPDNYYYGTRNSLRGIGFKYGKQFISPEQYDLRFNRPDLVLARLGYVPKGVIQSFHRAYQKRLQKLNFTEEMLGEEIHLPEARLITSQSSLKTSQPRFQFQVSASDDKFNLDRVNIFVNNIPVYGLKGIDLRGRELKDFTQTVDLALSSGKNKIQVSCLNEKGVESLLETFEIEYTPEKTVRPDLYIAVVSISNYENKSMNLKYARKDGQDIASMFRRSGWFENVFVDSLFDGRATRENILKLRENFSKSSVDDQVLFFVSGHGLLDANLDFYFATHDIEFKDPSEKGLRYDELEGLLDGIPARKKLLLMDACHSGEVDKTRIRVSEGTVTNKNARGLVEYTYPPDIQEEHYRIGVTTSFDLMQELFSNLSKGSGAVVISAAAGNSFALESDEWRNGVFTYSLLNGLKSKLADKNKNGEVTVSELKDFVSREVEKLTQGAQRPTSRRENLEFDFRVW